MFGMLKVDTDLVRNLDVKALILLASLLDTASVTRTAEAMHMSQPAASRAIERLRRAVGDPLLVRTRKGYALTSRAEELRPLVDVAISSVARVFERGKFDPAQPRRPYRIATTDYGAVAVITPLMIRLVAVAPLAVLDVTTWNSDTLERLETGKCDVALYADSELPPDFHYRELYRESYALVLRQSHPALNSLPKRPLGFKAALSGLSSYPRAVIMFPDGRQLVPDDVLGRLGMMESEVVLRTPYFMSAPWIIAQTDLVLCVPLRVADRLVANGGLLSIPAPPSLEPFGYRMIWHERTHRDPAQAWLRSLILEACRSMRLIKE